MVGLGDIAQVAVLPAFDRAAGVTCSALVSGDRSKRTSLGRKYDALHVTDYDGYDALLESGLVDAVYIALPNELHHDFAMRALRAGIHVLCEKPVTTTVREATQLAATAKRTRRCFMVAYRLHFDAATLHALSLAHARQTGELRLVASVFSSPVERGDIRLTGEGRGGLFDLGIYCVNAARMVFRSEPVEVAGMHAGQGSGLFRDVPEMTSAILRYPGDRLATFTCSLRAMRTNWWSALSTKRLVRMEPGFHYAEPLTVHLRSEAGLERRRTFPKRDQFAAELEYFAGCVRRGRVPEPSAVEGLADIRILDAIDRSARTGRAVRLKDIKRDAQLPR